MQNEALGIRKYGYPLRPAHEATKVRVCARRILLTKSLAAKSMEKVSAYEPIECSSSKEATEIA